MRNTYRDLPDLELRDAVLTGNNLAWCELINRFRGLIFRCIHKAIGKFENTLPSEAAEEIFSEVCFNLLRKDMRKLRLYDPEKGSKLGSWIGLISINTAYDHLRSCARRPMLDQIDGTPDRADSAPSPLDQLLQRERWYTLSRMAAGFSDRDRRFMDLYFRMGLSPAEVARLMDISVKTVYSKKNKIRKRLMAMPVPDQVAAAA